MGLKENMKEMYRRLGVMDERVSKLQNLEIPKKGDVAKDLGKAKNQKDFDKKKKDWQTKLDKVDSALKDVDSIFDSFTDQIKKVDSDNSRQWQDNTVLEQIDIQITAAEDTDKILKKAGQPAVLGDYIKRLQTQRKDFIDKRKQAHDELKQETNAMFKLYETASDKYAKIKSGDLAAEKDALKNAKFGAGARVGAGRR
jgi:hypothetical protein